MEDGTEVDGEEEAGEDGMEEDGEEEGLVGDQQQQQ